MSELSCLIMTGEEEEAYEELQKLLLRDGANNYARPLYSETCRRTCITDAALCVAFSPLAILIIYLSKRQ